MRKLQRILCMCMVLVLCLPMLFACGGDGATTTRKDPAKDTTKGGGTPDDGFTVGDLGTDTIHINISVNQDSETTFPAQDRYVKGPDKVGEDEVQNMVFRRNLSQNWKNAAVRESSVIRAPAEQRSSKSWARKKSIRVQ